MKATKEGEETSFQDVVEQLVQVMGGSGGGKNLPTSRQLFGHLYGEVLLSPICKDLYIADVVVHLLSAVVAISLGWLRFVFPALMHIKFKTYFIG